MEGLIIIAFVIFGIFIFIIQTSRYESKIEEKIKSIGGQVINIERKNLFTGIGPFMVVGKGRSVYRIEYTVNGVTKEGWVRFGGLFGADWRL